MTTWSTCTASDFSNTTWKFLNVKIAFVRQLAATCMMLLPPEDVRRERSMTTPLAFFILRLQVQAELLEIASSFLFA